MTKGAHYIASPTFGRFHMDNSFFRCVMGPVGTGKTVGGVMELFRRMCEQEPHADGVRRTRWAVIRSTYPELVSTTIRTFEDWIGGLGTLVLSTPIRWNARFRLADKTIVECEIFFLALERDGDASKLKSLELTGAYISEYAEIPKGIIDVLRTRVGRYPASKDGPITWRGIWAESNPPSDKSFWYDLFEREQPKDHVLFKQPPALLYDPYTETYAPNPAAENIENLDLGYEYYFQQINGANEDFIRVFVMGEYGVTHSGKRVYATFSDRQHVRRKTDMAPVSKAPLVIGMDWGLHPAAVITQLSSQGALMVFDEIVASDVTLAEFLDEAVLPLLRNKYPRWPVQIVADPAGGRTRHSKKSDWDYVRERNLPIAAAPTNDPLTRIEAVKSFLNRTDGLIVNVNCSNLVEGFNGQYHYAKSKATGSEAMYKEVPEKNHPYSDVHDALQYAAMHHRGVTTRAQRKRARGANKPPTQRGFLYA